MNLTIPPSLKVKIDNRLLVLDTTSPIGDGGEAIIIKENIGGVDYAIKIIHPALRSDARVKKLEAQIKRIPPLPGKTVKPVKPVYDENNKIIGHCMELIQMDKYNEMSWWFNRQFRKDNKITFADICIIFYELKSLLQEIHRAGYVIGDFNPGGILVLKKQFWNKNNEFNRVRIVDTDTMEFDNYPCVVYSLSWFDYKNAKNIKDLGKKRIYNNETDYFSYDAIFFEALTTVGVYDGFHDLFDSRKTRMERGLTILHSEVEYPDDAVPFDTLPIDFQNQFKDVFVNGARKLIEDTSFMRALGMSVQPTLQPRQTPVVHTQAVRIYNEIITGYGDIIDFIVNGNTINILTRDRDVFKYLVYFENNIQSHTIPNTSDKNYYRIIDSGYIIETPSAFGDESVVKLRIYSIEKKQWIDVTTMMGIRRIPIVTGGNGKIITAARNFLIEKYFDDINGAFIQRHMVNKNTFVKTDPVSGNTMGYIRTGMNYNWFFMRNNMSYDIDISELDDTEVLRDLAVYFHNNTSLVIRLTEYKGAFRTRLDEISLSSNHIGSRLIFNRIIDGELINPLSSAAYVHNGTDAILFYASNNGIVRENIVSGDIKQFQQTQKIVRKGSYLRFFKEGMAVIDDDKIKYIAM